MPNFEVDDLVTINRPDSEAHGVVGLIVAADRVSRWAPPTRPRWTRVLMGWPGSATMRAYSFTDADLLPYSN